MKGGYIFNVLVLFIAFAGIKAQDKTLGDQVTSLHLKSSPAFVVLGVEPENIQRPNSPTDFLASVNSAVVNEKLQPGFAIETSPYYWGENKNKSNYENIDYIFSSNYGNNLLRSLTFSFASSASDTLSFGGTQKGTAFGIGMHLQLVQGKPSKKTVKKLTEWYVSSYSSLALMQILESINTRGRIDDLDTYLEEVLSVGSFKLIEGDQKKVIKLLLRQMIGSNSLNENDAVRIKSINENLKHVSEITINDINKYTFPLTREGFMLEFAIANASLAVESQWKQFKSAKTSIWITPSYRFNINKDKESSDFFDIIAVSRMTFNAKQTDVSNYYEFGGKLQWIHNRISISGEYISRYLSEKPDTMLKNHTSRMAFSFAYKLTDNFTFQMSMGSNFDGNSTTYSDPAKMFVVGGLNFGFSSLFK
ncbi:MAG: hypothetical protein ACN6OJ_14635 [Chryseobacterium sp.]|uniref:hypothetical protein n=1 Tax=Chryseobacterium sp. TaxID=1871047 RepID=UPI003D107615